MEVHHHPHVEKKGFKEYFLEFLMIFLAVTLGFFAENIREGITDTKKEKQYMVLLEQDLKKDTAALHYSIRRLNTDFSSEDSIISLFAENRLGERDDSTLSLLFITSGLSVDIAFNDRAATQLKNSDAMRLIRHKDVVANILQYWNNQIRINQIHDRFENQRLQHHQVAYRTFNWYREYYINAEGSSNAVLHSRPKTIVNPANLNEFVNIVADLYNTGKNQYMPYLEEQLQLANKLIGLIKKEYDLPVETNED
jgi:hypothetical protein